MADPPLPPEISSEADSVDLLIDANRRSFKVLLLGSGTDPANARLAAQALLRSQGYAVHTAEEVAWKKGEGVEAKWMRVMAEVDPEHIVVVVSKEGKPGGFEWELGNLRSNMDKDEFRESVSFFLEEGLFPTAVLGAYALEEVGYCVNGFYQNSDQLARRIARRIDNILLERIERTEPPDLETQPFLGDGRSRVLCPRCGEPQVHLERVTVEQGPETVEVTAPGSLTTQDANRVHPWRGSAIVIHFLCEFGHRFSLRFRFHKGWTLLQALLGEDFEGREPFASEMWRD